jgi:two-component system chemotaxis sensor kinase CheA
MTDIHQQAFQEEARELLCELETALLELESTPADQELIGRVFRAMHTIKGSGAMFGFEDIASFTHNVETVYDLVRNGKMPVTKDLIDLTLSACDQIRKMVEAFDTATVTSDENTEKIVSAFRGLLQDAKAQGGDTLPQGVPLPDSPEPTAVGDLGKEKSLTCRIRFRPHHDIFSYGTNPVLLLKELRDLGVCHIVAHTDAIPELAEIDPESCYAYWDIILTTTQSLNAVRDVFIFAEDNCELKIDVIDEGAAVDEDLDYKKVGEILIERGDLSGEEVKNLLGTQKRIGELLVDSGLIDPGKVESALAEQKHVREIRQKKQAAESAASIRVPAEKLDGLVNMVGELVTLQSRLSQIAGKMADMRLIQIAEDVERLTAEIRDNTMSIRMLPIGTLFSKFQRLVRDLSRDLGKEIVLTTEGEETELDKTVIERLNDPLVHLIRNSIDHGIELPGVREAAGKPGQGHIHLTAEHSGANVFLKIQDDGAGLNIEAIRAKAVEKGLIPPDAVLPEKELFSLIFQPGFSTAQTVTSVSGRGVGMDVVRKSIDTLQGSIEIESIKGQGSTVTLKLPLTLAIIDGLLVKIDEQFFVMPLSIIEECVELSREDVAKAHGKKIAEIRGEIVPYIHLRGHFMMGGNAPLIEQIVTARIDGLRIGFVVDQVVGEYQTVIKTLGRAYRNVVEVSGATILGDGHVALILDLPRLLQKAEMEERIRT